MVGVVAAAPCRAASAPVEGGIVQVIDDVRTEPGIAQASTAAVPLVSATGPSARPSAVAASAVSAAPAGAMESRR